jgi:hypothetical protein
MRALLLLCAVGLLHAADTVEVFGHKWSVPIAADWAVEKQDGVDVMRMLVERPQTQPRRPSQFALASDTPDFQQVTVEAEVKRLGGSLIFVYAYTDPAHFNYAHLSVDAPAKQPVHNGIFHVYGGDRVRISSAAGPGSLLSNAEWYRVRLDYDAATGLVEVKVNGQQLPSLRGIDLSLGAGKVGIGSFFEKALFRNVKITGRPAQ